MQPVTPEFQKLVELMTILGIVGGIVFAVVRGIAGLLFQYLSSRGKKDASGASGSVTPRTLEASLAGLAEATQTLSITTNTIIERQSKHIDLTQNVKEIVLDNASIISATKSDLGIAMERQAEMRKALDDHDRTVRVPRRRK